MTPDFSRIFWLAICTFVMVKTSVYSEDLPRKAQLQIDNFLKLHFIECNSDGFSKKVFKFPGSDIFYTSGLQLRNFHSKTSIEPLSPVEKLNNISFRVRLDILADAWRNFSYNKGQGFQVAAQHGWTDWQAFNLGEIAYQFEQRNSSWSCDRIANRDEILIGESAPSCEEVTIWLTYGSLK